jgi:TnpA family transposase
VQKALNRGESDHQLRRAIAYAHGGHFRVRSQHQQNVWNECARLIANAVVYYNSRILSEVLGALESHQALASAEDLKRVSPAPAFTISTASLSAALTLGHTTG